jgi:hypothetical protein
MFTIGASIVIDPQLSREYSFNFYVFISVLYNYIKTIFIYIYIKTYKPHEWNTYQLSITTYIWIPNMACWKMSHLQINSPVERPFSSGISQPPKWTDSTHHASPLSCLIISDGDYRLIPINTDHHWSFNTTIWSGVCFWSFLIRQNMVMTRWIPMTITHFNGITRPGKHTKSNWKWPWK